MSNTYNLQLRHGAESKSFSSREEVLKYIDGQIQYGGVQLLPYEPVLFFYGPNEDKNTIILVGLPEGSKNESKTYFIIDTKDLKEQIKAIDEKYEKAINELKEGDKTTLGKVKESLAELAKKTGELDEIITEEFNKVEDAQGKLEKLSAINKSDIKNLVEACGLIYNDKMTDGRIYFSPDSHDEILRDATNISDAINKVSKFAYDLANELKLTTKNSDTITLIQNKEAKTLEAEVNIAGTEGLSKKSYDNNIIGKTKDGLYASVSIEPSSKNPSILIFKTSGYINGQFLVDAFETEVPLVKYLGDNGQASGINVRVDENRGVISAELNLSTAKDNILKLQDGEYSVSGTSENIKHGVDTVAKALDGQAEKITAIENKVEFLKAVDINGIDSETTSTHVTNNATKGSTNISSDVKLSRDRSIIVSDGGLKANVRANFKKGTSTLILEVGNTEYPIDLSELAVSVLESADYDSTNEEIVLKFHVGDTIKSMRIPVSKLIHDIEADDSNTIDFELRSTLGGPNRLSADLKIDNSKSDNMITVSSNGVYVSKKVVTDAIAEDSAIHRAEEERIKTSIEKLTEQVNANKEALRTEATTAREAERVNGDAIANLSRTVTSEIASVSKLIADNVKLIAGNTEQINNVKELVRNNTASIETEKARAEREEALLTSKVTVTEKEIEGIKKSTTELTNRVTSDESTINRHEEKLTEHSNSIGRIETEITGIELRREGEQAYALYVRGNKKGEIIIPKDQFLENVSYEDGNKELVFNFNTANGPKIAKVSMRDLIDTYNAGEGLLLANKAFSVDFNKVVSQEKLREVKTEFSTLKDNINANLSNINNEISSLKSNASGSQTKFAGDITRIESAIGTISGSIEAVRNSLNSEIGRAERKESDITNLLSNEVIRSTNRENEIEKVVNLNVDKIKQLEQSLNTKISANTEAISGLNTKEVTTSIKLGNLENKVTEFIASAREEYKNQANENRRIDGRIDSAIERLTEKVNNTKVEVANQIGSKADSTSVYNKEQVLKLLEGYAQKAETTSGLAEKLSTVEAKNVYATKEALNDVKSNYALSQTVTELNNNLRGLIERNKTSIDNFGLEYNEATSELSFRGKDGAINKYKLYGGSLVKGGRFDQASNSIVLTLENAGQSSELTIPVSHLLGNVNTRLQTSEDKIQRIETSISKLNPELEVRSSQTVELVKSKNGEKDAITANVRVASGNKQAIQNRGEGLYVSNDLEDYTCVFGSEGTVSAQKAVSSLLESVNQLKSDSQKSLTNATSEIDKLKAQLGNNINSDIDRVKKEIGAYNGELEKLKESAKVVTDSKEKVDAIQGKVDGFEGRVVPLETTTHELEGRVGINEGDIRTLKTNVGNLQMKDGEFERRIAALENKIDNDIATKLCDLEGISTQHGNTIADLTKKYEVLQDSVNEFNSNLKEVNDGLVQVRSSIGDSANSASKANRENKQAIDGILEDIRKIKEVLPYLTYSNAKNVLTRLDELEDKTGDKLESKFTTITNNLIGPKDGSVDGTIWHELNNLLDVGTY